MGADLEGCENYLLMVRSAASRVSNHEAWAVASSFETLAGASSSG